jgi:hypothetical protein
MRVFAVLALARTYNAGLAAQVTKPQPPPLQPPQAAVTLETDARQVREQFEALLMKYPPDVGRILKMDPTMLTNQQYLAQYPGIQQFIAAHPEIARNPAFYLEFVRQAYDYTRPVDPQSRAMEMWRSIYEGLGVFAIVVFISSMLAWLVKTVLNHRRWLRTFRIQSEVHTKLLDRFAGTSELLSYIQTPAGRRFLEAEPIPVEAAVAGGPIAAPLNRILWSVQAGIVLVLGGLAFQYISGRVMPDVDQGFWVIGVLATALGLGFILAAGFSFVISRRLGLLETAGSLPPRERGDSTAV